MRARSRRPARSGTHDAGVFRSPCAGTAFSRRPSSIRRCSSTESCSSAKGCDTTRATSRARTTTSGRASSGWARAANDVAPLVLYRVHPAQASQRRRDVQRSFQLEVARREIADVAPGLGPADVELAWRIGAGEQVAAEDAEQAVACFLAPRRRVRSASSGCARRGAASCRARRAPQRGQGGRRESVAPEVGVRARRHGRSPRVRRPRRTRLAGPSEAPAGRALGARARQRGRRGCSARRRGLPGADAVPRRRSSTGSRSSPSSISRSSTPRPRSPTGRGRSSSRMTPSSCAGWACPGRSACCTTTTR